MKSLIARRKFITQFASCAGLTAISARARSQTTEYPAVDVRSFGACNAGMSDCTAAFNRATLAAEEWSDRVTRRIHVPAGKYRIDGTVFVRKGQSFTGDGVATLIDARQAQGVTFLLGCQQTGENWAEDPGGAPVEFSNLRTIGGNAEHATVKAVAHGFTVKDLFLSAPGIGLELCGSDGHVSNVTIDQGLNGLIIHRSRNIIISNIIIFYVNYGITIGEEAGDLQFSDCLIEYTRNASILIAEKSSKSKGLAFRGMRFVSSVREPRFVGHIHIRGSDTEVTLSDCQFSNWSGYAIDLQAGRSTNLTLTNCAFEGQASQADYQQSLDPKAICIGQDALVRLTDCRFVSLTDGAIANRGRGVRLEMDGGAFESCKGARITGLSPTKAQIANVEGLARIIEPDAVALPRGINWYLEAWLKSSAGPIFYAGEIQVQGDKVTVTPVAASLAVFALATFPGNDEIVIRAKTGVLMSARLRSI